MKAKIKDGFRPTIREFINRPALQEILNNFFKLKENTIKCGNVYRKKKLKSN